MKILLTYMVENVVLADCPADEIKSFVEGLNELSEQKYQCVSEVACGIRTGIISEIGRYKTYFKAGWHAFKNRKKYGVIIGWQQFYALIFCFYCRLCHVKKENTVVALNFTYKAKRGLIGVLYKWFMKQCVCGGYLDYIHVPSESYADQFCKDFGFEKKNIIVMPFGIDDIYDEWKDSAVPVGCEKNGYAMSIGRSNRDFDFLVEAWSKIELPLVIISDSYSPRCKLPENVVVLDNIAGKDQYPYIVNAKMVIIPIADGRICSGDTVLLTSFSFEKKVIVTKPSTLGEMYIQNKENGYLIEKNMSELITLVDEICMEDNNEVGKQARDTYLNRYSRYSMGRRVAEFIREEI